MKLVIYTCAYGRYPVLRIYIDWLNFVRSKYDIIPVIVADDPKIGEMCQENKIIHFSAPNKPLGAKFNTLSLLKAIDFDYLMVMGSDDICNMRMIKLYFKMMETGREFWGLKDKYFYDAKSKKTKYWGGFRNYRRGECLGGGRCLSHGLLDKLDWQPWQSDLNSKLDKSMTAKMNALGVEHHAMKMIDNDCFILGTKVENNISKFHQYPGAIVNNKILYGYFPKLIVDKILAL